MAQSWWTAALSKAQRMPKLETLLSRSDERGRKQTPQQMKEAIRSMVGEFQTRKPARG